MGVIARTGAITHLDPVVASIPAEDLSLFYANLDEPPFKFTLTGNDDRPQPSWPRFMGFELDHPKSGLITPQFFHLFPAFGAYLFETMGVRGALATPPIFGILGTLAAFFLARRMFGTAVALIGTLGLATTVLQVWFARYPVSEGFSQFLILSGLVAHRMDHESDSRAFGWLAGTLLGLTLLVRIDSVLLLLPLALWIALQFVSRPVQWKARAMSLLVPFAVLLVHATVHAVFFAKRYAHQILTRRYWNHAALVLAAPRRGRRDCLVGGLEGGPEVGGPGAATRGDAPYRGGGGSGPGRDLRAHPSSASIGVGRRRRKREGGKAG